MNNCLPYKYSMLKPYYQDDFITLYCGDAREVLLQLKSESVQCVVTSPPYFGLRQYLFDGAVRLRRDLSDDEQKRVLLDLEKLGIKPKTN